MRANADPHDDIAIVAIGRNEGDRLARCLDSMPAQCQRVYVDSGSTDNSLELALAAGVEIVNLDISHGFTAARARNAGMQRLRENGCDRRYVQMVDGDCEIRSDWLTTAAAALDADPGLAVVFGRRRERFPGHSIYNGMCDVEWAVPPGLAMACGGDALFRRAAIEAVGGYTESMIAGEEPDLSLRMREVGWSIRCLEAEMTWHDAAILRFSQWWRRTKRAGHAFAELVSRHPSSALHSYTHSRRRILFWGGLLPALMMAGLFGALVDRSAGWLALTAGPAALFIFQIARLTIRERRYHPLRRAFPFALLLVIGKFAEMSGMIEFALRAATGRRATLIEYKASSPKQPLRAGKIAGPTTGDDA